MMLKRKLRLLENVLIFGIYGFRTECANANELDFIIDVLQKHNGIETKTAS
mgnify:CR=1 FL=1